jgi:hypothetical protein
MRAAGTARDAKQQALRVTASIPFRIIVFQTVANAALDARRGAT